jgi:small subunit ribosomal protein S2
MSGQDFGAMAEPPVEAAIAEPGQPAAATEPETAEEGERQIDA